LGKLATQHAPAQALADDYADDEKAFATQLRDFVVGQAAKLTALASDAVKVKVKDEYL
jgi:serine/threonine-protein kinase HipA